ncbi:MAG: amidohydrolase family protein [Zhaonellaceae bacterium]|nr:amidohydrolase [Clostridia bacterium]
MIDILLLNGTVVTVNKKREIIEDGAVAIKGDKIVDIGLSKILAEKYSDAKTKIDATGKVLFPGLINTHNHLFQSLLKGLGDDRVLSDWLVQVMFPSAAKLTSEEAYYGALLGCMDGIHSGTTTIMDYMHAHPRTNLADGVIKAFQTLGVRGILARGYMDNGADFGTPKAIMQDSKTIEDDCVRLLDTYHNLNNGRIKIWIAPAAVWLSTKESLLMSKRLADAYKTGIAVHISETPFDREASRILHGKWDIDVLEELDVMGPNVLMVHCVHLTPRDIRMTKFYDAKVSHNPVSNMYLSSGVAPVPRMIEAGITVGVATDGAASNNSNDMIEVLKFTALLQKVHHLDPTIITAEKVLEMATIDGARALGLENEIGSLEVGKKADLFVFNPKLSAKAVPMHNPVSTLVYSSSTNNVETVIIDGKIIMENGKILTVNEGEMLCRAQQVAEELSIKAETNIYKKRPWRSLAY